MGFALIIYNGVYRRPRHFFTKNGFLRIMGSGGIEQNRKECIEIAIAKVIKKDPDSVYKKKKHANKLHVERKL